MYQSHLYTVSPGALSAMVVAAAVVYLLCWLYNAHRLRKFKKANLSQTIFFLKSPRAKRRFLIGLTVLIVLLALLLWYAPKFFSRL